MECKKFELTASAYIDRQLGELQAVEYKDHLSGCPGCRLRLTELEEVSLVLRKTDRPEVPREILLRVQ